MKREMKRSSFWHMLPVIFTLAWPTMLEQLMQTAVQYIDTAMVGTLGTDATAAVGSTTTVNWLINITISALSIGFLAYIAQAHGAKDHSRAVRASGQAVLATLVTGVLFTVLALSLSGLVPVWMQVDPAIRRLASEYFFILYLPMLPRAATIFFGTVLRAVGDTKTPMRVGILINIINVILNFLLIYPTRTLWFFTMPGMGLGIHGAALASAIAFTVGGFYMTADCGNIARSAQDALGECKTARSKLCLNLCKLRCALAYLRFTAAKLLFIFSSDFRNFCICKRVCRFHSQSPLSKVLYARIVEHHFKNFFF